uniref:Uncharacterized protein n=1 Tax=Anguilla anguilla TaxID=7936 RepID=A0A0E9PTS6_ANGAN
MREPTLFAL